MSRGCSSNDVGHEGSISAGSSSGQVDEGFLSRAQNEFFSRSRFESFEQNSVSKLWCLETHGMQDINSEACRLGFGLLARAQGKRSRAGQGLGRFTVMVPAAETQFRHERPPQSKPIGGLRLSHPYSEAAGVGCDG